MSINECSNIAEIKSMAQLYQKVAHQLPEQQPNQKGMVKGIAAFRKVVIDKNTNELVDALDIYQLLKYIRYRLDSAKQGCAEPGTLGSLQYF